MQFRKSKEKRVANMHTFEAIGTTWRIDISDLHSEALQQEALRAVFARIAEFDKNYSRFRNDSLVSEMAQKAGTYTLPTDAKPMFDLYRALYELTHGAFTPLIGQTLVDAGYDASYSLKPSALSPPPAWDEAMTYDFPSLTMRSPTLLDVGACGKGYLIDIVGKLLKSFGIHAFCIDAGGDMLYANPTQVPLRVGLEHPNDTTQVVGVAEVPPGSICGSAGNRRTWGEFHHTIDPRTLASPKHILATWTIAPTALLADALATCLSFVPANVLHAQYDFMHCMLYPDMTIETSPNFPGEFFYASS
jgi:FAD:protein FMN transferase